MSRRLLALGLAAVLVVGAQPSLAAQRPGVTREADVQAQPSGAPASVAPGVPGVVGDDACGLLSDEEILAATGSTGVLSRTPGSQSLLPAGCYWQLESSDTELYGPWELYLGVQVEGGRQRFEQELSFFDAPRIAGLGDEAAELLGAYSAVKGDVYVSLQYLAFGFPPMPSSLSARALTWLVMKRLPEGDGTTDGPASSGLTPAQELVARIRAEPFGDANVDAAIELLARSGIGTWEDPSAAGPIRPVDGAGSPVRLLRDQVRAMALEAWAAGGILGADLDELVDADPDLAPASWVLAGYAADVDTEGAQVARALMGEPDWGRPDQVVFPQLVLALFTSDVARERMAEAGVASAPRLSGPAHAAVLADVRTAQAGLCTQAASFLDATLSRVFDALRLGQSGGGNILVTIWGFVVSLAERAARAIVRELTQPVLDLIGKVASMAAMANAIVSVIRPWTVTVVGVPPVTAKGVGGSPGQPGALVVRVDLGGLDDWPALVKDCARVAGHPLPNLKPEGAPVTWSVAQYPGGLVAETARQSRLDAAGQARLDYVTLVDDIPAPWRDEPGQLATTVIVERPGLRQLRGIALDALFGQLGRARGIVEPYLRPIIERLTARVGQLVSSRAFGPTTVIRHVPEATPEPDATPGPTAPPREVWVHLDRPAMGDIIQAAMVIELYSCSGPYGVWSGVVRLGGVGPVPLAELPLSFGFRGASGVQRATASVTDRIEWDLPGVAYDARVGLDVSVDGRTMTVATTISLDEQVQGTSLLGGEGQGTVALPIEPAPPGSC